MSLFVLDTDIVSLLQRGHPRVVSRCAARRPEELAITVISLEEQLSGWYNLLRKTKQPDELVTAYQSLIDSLLFLARLSILPLTLPAIARFQHLIGLKLNVGRMDLRIAAIVLEHQGVLITRNVRDFARVPAPFLSFGFDPSACPELYGGGGESEEDIVAETLLDLERGFGAVLQRKGSDFKIPTSHGLPEHDELRDEQSRRD